MYALIVAVYFVGGHEDQAVFSALAGSSALCELTADVQWYDRPAPGSATGQSSGSMRDSDL